MLRREKTPPRARRAPPANATLRAARIEQDIARLFVASAAARAEAGVHGAAQAKRQMQRARQESGQHSRSECRKTERRRYGRHDAPQRLQKQQLYMKTDQDRWRARACATSRVACSCRRRTSRLPAQQEDSRDCRTAPSRDARVLPAASPGRGAAMQHTLSPYTACRAAPEDPARTPGAENRQPCAGLPRSGASACRREITLVTQQAPACRPVARPRMRLRRSNGEGKIKQASSVAALNVAGMMPPAIR